LADAIPSPEELSVKKAFDLAKRKHRSAGHRPFISDRNPD